jgi:hypothetical protein
LSSVFLGIFWGNKEPEWSASAMTAVRFDFAVIPLRFIPAFVLYKTTAGMERNSINFRW